MAWILEVNHVTTYRYARPVQFGEHRLLFRPRTGHDIRVLDASVVVEPHAEIHSVLDVFSNTVTIISPRFAADTLRVACNFAVAHEGTPNLELPVAPHAARYPFDYTVEERRDLGALLEPHYPDPDGRIYGWTRQFFQYDPRPATTALLAAITNAIKTQIRYVPRYAEGTQTPSETLTQGGGTCRDFALLMMEAVRRLGLAARFVSGYLYDPALDGGEGDIQGAGATHAWMQVYLPGSGWVSFDPTNSTFGGASLIRVAYTRDPRQALPLAGWWTGAASDYLGMSVDVRVARRHRD